MLRKAWIAKALARDFGNLVVRPSGRWAVPAHLLQQRRCGCASGLQARLLVRRSLPTVCEAGVIHSVCACSSSYWARRSASARPRRVASGRAQVEWRRTGGREQRDGCGETGWRVSVGPTQPCVRPASSTACVLVVATTGRGGRHLRGYGGSRSPAVACDASLERRRAGGQKPRGGCGEADRRVVIGPTQPCSSPASFTACMLVATATGRGGWHLHRRLGERAREIGGERAEKVRRRERRVPGVCAAAAEAEAWRSGSRRNESGLPNGVRAVSSRLGTSVDFVS